MVTPVVPSAQSGEHTGQQSWGSPAALHPAVPVPGRAAGQGEPGQRQAAVSCAPWGRPAGNAGTEGVGSDIGEAFHERGNKEK